MPMRPLERLGLHVLHVHILARLGALDALRKLNRGEVQARLLAWISAALENKKVA